LSGAAARPTSKVDPEIPCLAGGRLLCPRFAIEHEVIGMEVRELASGVYWVGIRDWERRMFDALVPLPTGTSYNSYVVKGGKATALVDTANPGFEEELRSKVEQVVPMADLDYLVMNHAEPDHAGAIPYVLAKAPKAKLVLTSQGAKMAEALFRVPRERMMVVKEDDRIDLGGKTLRFIEAPFLHWPETMFTYAEEDKVLMTCDFFGAHTAFADFSRQVPDYDWIAKKYFGEIMMPFAKNGRNAMEKIDRLPIGLIGPSHGPMHDDPPHIMSLYRNWTQGRTVRKVVVAYATMWQSTHLLVEAMNQAMLEAGIQVHVYDLATSDAASLAGDLVDAEGLVLGAPTVLGGLHPLGLYAASLIKAFKPPVKFAAVVSSYGWGGGAVKQALDILGPMKVEVIGTVDVHGRPSDVEIEKARELGKAMAQKVMPRPME
jgi:flavorubredoxin